jgi:ATP-binding cassette, subfamily B, bacterial
MYGRAFFVSLTLVAALAQALVYGLGGYYAITGSLSAGTVVTLALLLTRLYGPLTALSNARVDVMSALVSFDRVFEILDLEPMITDAPGAVELPTDARTVEFADVHFAYPTAAEVSLASLEDVVTLDRTASAEVLHGVSFRAEAGQLIALVGPSGAGKTTISQLVPRIYDVTGGQVLIGGHDVRAVTQQSLHDRIGVVSQDAHLFHDTIRANLLYGAPGAGDDAIRAAVDDAQITDLVASLPDGLDTVVGDRGYRLSGGEKARLAIARLLLKAPEIVILDEATAHLDSESEAAVQAALARALVGRTSLVIAHRLSTIRNADLVLVLEAGTIVEQGRHADLLAAGGLYSELYRTRPRGGAARVVTLADRCAQSSSSATRGCHGTNRAVAGSSSRSVRATSAAPSRAESSPRPGCVNRTVSKGGSRVYRSSAVSISSRARLSTSESEPPRITSCGLRVLTRLARPRPRARATVATASSGRS